MTDPAATPPPSPRRQNGAPRAATLPAPAAAAHAAALDRVRHFAPPLVRSGVAGAKRPTASTVPAAGAKRFRAAEAWSPCPVGTLPSGIPGVGTTPEFRWRAAADAAGDGGAGGGAIEAEEQGPGEAAPSGALAGGADAPAAPGGVGATADAEDTVAAKRTRAIESAAQQDVLAALGTVSGFVWEEVGGEDEPGSSGASGGVVHGDGGAEGGVEVLGLHSMVRGSLREPSRPPGLRERVLRACAGVLR